MVGKNDSDLVSLHVLFVNCSPSILVTLLSSINVLSLSSVGTVIYPSSGGKIGNELQLSDVFFVDSDKLDEPLLFLTSLNVESPSKVSILCISLKVFSSLCSCFFVLFCQLSLFAVTASSSTILSCLLPWRYYNILTIMNPIKINLYFWLFLHKHTFILLRTHIFGNYFIHVHFILSNEQIFCK